MKTCNNSLGNCSYKTITGLFFGCSYDCYCDYQAPKDSRTIPTTFSPEICTCIQRFSIDSAGNCSSCGKKRSY